MHLYSANFYMDIFSCALPSHENTAVSRKVVQLKSIKAYATITKGMMGCACPLLHRQVHAVSSQRDGRRCYEYLFALLKETKWILSFNMFIKIYLVFPRPPFGIVAYAFMLFLDNLC